MSRPNAVVQIIATVTFKIWLNQDELDEAYAATLEDAANAYLAERINDHPDIQADLESVDHTEVLDPGPFVEEGVECPDCQGFYFDKKEAAHIYEYGVCTSCPDPELEELD